MVLRAGETLDCPANLQAVIAVLEAGRALIKTAFGPDLHMSAGEVLSVTRLPVSSIQSVGKGVVVIVVLA